MLAPSPQAYASHLVTNKKRKYPGLFSDDQWRLIEALLVFAYCDGSTDTIKDIQKQLGVKL